MNLLSDAAQSETWPHIKPQLTKGKTLYFSHGFSPVFNDLTKVDVPKDIDVILVAPKGSGRTVRSLFREGRGINSSVAVYQDVTGKALEKAIAVGVAVGSGYLYETTFQKEVYSDLYGERGCLMGGIHGMFLAQYEVLRERGHSPSEAFNETVEEATQSLYPLIGANGMDYMYAACSTTARRGAIDWSAKFKDALKPVFNELYDRVEDGTETQRSLDYNSAPDYREKYDKEMEEIRSLEIWRAGKAVRYVFIAFAYTYLKAESNINFQFPPPRERLGTSASSYGRCSYPTLHATSTFFTWAGRWSNPHKSICTTSWLIHTGRSWPISCGPSWFNRRD
jgi:ketol-acid reductoisomerase